MPAAGLVAQFASDLVTATLLEEVQDRGIDGGGGQPDRQEDGAG